MENQVRFSFLPDLQCKGSLINNGFHHPKFACFHASKAKKYRASRTLAREHHLLQSLTTFLATGRTATITSLWEMEGVSLKSPQAGGGGHQRGAPGHHATTLSPAGFNEVRRPQDSSAGTAWVISYL